MACLRTAYFLTQETVTIVGFEGFNRHVARALLQPPLHFAAKPFGGFAVSVTVVPTGNVLLQRVPQLMPAGALLTIPLGAFMTVTATLRTGIEPSELAANKPSLPTNMALNWRRLLAAGLAVQVASPEVFVVPVHSR